MLALLGLLMPATAAVSLTQSAPARVAKAAPVQLKSFFATEAARTAARSYHSPASAGAGAERPGSVSGTVGFWMLAGLALILLAASLSFRVQRR